MSLDEALVRSPMIGGVALTLLALASEREMRPLVAHCHLGLGKLCGHRGEHQRAREHVTTAQTLYREMDMGVYLGPGATPGPLPSLRSRADEARDFPPSSHRAVRC